jgi:hypothetical protein
MRDIKSVLTIAATFLTPFLSVDDAFAGISFVSATPSVTLTETIEDGADRVFVFDGLMDGQSATLTFATDTTCPGVAMTGGGEFGPAWTCSNGVITANVIFRGGLSFGPSSEVSPKTFYVTFSNPPTPPGQDAPVAALSGIQLSVFGDINRWDLDGNVTSAGAVFGVELSGPEGGEAHFRMDLPQAAAKYLGGVLGVFIGGKPDPFAAVSENEDKSVSIDVDIAQLTSARGAFLVPKAPRTVTKKITAGARTLSVGFDRSSVKTGKSVAIKVCAGEGYETGDTVPARFTLGSSALSLRKSVKLGTNGCGQSSVTLRSIKPGTLTAQVSYKGKRAKTTLKITK